VIITLRIPTSCNPNGSHGNRYAKSRERKAERQAAHIEARGALGRGPAPKWASGTLRVTWFARHPTHLPDEDNVRSRLKPFQDGLVDAGWFSTDKKITMDYVALIGSPRVMIEAVGPHGETE